MKVGFAIFFLVLSVTSVFGQEVSDIQKEYGVPTPAYSLSEHFWMTPEFGVDGEICKARLYPKRISSKTNYLSRVFGSSRNRNDCADGVSSMRETPMLASIKIMDVKHGVLKQDRGEWAKAFMCMA